MRNTIIVVVILLAAAVLIGLSFGFRVCTSVALLDFSVSEDGSELQFRAGVTTSMGYIRAYHDSGLTMKSEDNLPHVHFFTEFHYLYEGYEKISIPQKKKEVTLKAGEICLIPRRLYHAVDTDDRVKRICFNLTASELFGTLDDIIVIRNGYICSVMERFLEKNFPKQEEASFFWR